MINENLKHAVDTLTSTADWTLNGAGQNWAELTYVHGVPGDHRKIRLDVVYGEAHAQTYVSLVRRAGAKHYFRPWWGLVIERSVHDRVYAYVIFRGRTFWLRHL